MATSLLPHHRAMEGWFRKRFTFSVASFLSSYSTNNNANVKLVKFFKKCSFKKP